MNRKEIEVTKETCASIVLCNIPWQLSSTTDQERALYPANHNSLARIFLARFSHRKSIHPFICPSFRISFSSFVRLSFCSYVGSLVHSFLHSIFSSLVRR